MTDDISKGPAVPERKPPFDVLGVCIGRDVFGVANCNEYEIRKYTRPSLPSFADDERVKESERLGDDDVKGKTRYLRRRKLDDLNRTCEEGLWESGSEWLLLEIRTVSYEYWEARYGGKTHYFLGNTTTEEEMRKAVEKRGLELESLRKVKIDGIPGTSEMVDAACDFIRKRYGNNVILLQQKEALWRMDRFGNVALNRTLEAESMNSTIDKFTRMILRNLGCHFIRIPSDIISDAWQRWGDTPAHYIQEYYDYAYACVDDIVSGIPNLDRSLERRFMEFSAQLNAIRSGKMLSRKNAVSRVSDLMERRGNADLCIKAATHLRRRANNPMLEAELDGAMGKLWRDRADGKADPEKAMALMKSSAESGIEWAQTEYLGMLRASGNYEATLEAAIRFASLGNGEAIGFVGRAYKNGEGVGKDKAIAEKWLEEASVRDVKWAVLEYMQLLWEEDADILVEKAQRFANHSGIAMGYLGRAYRYGKGTKKDLAKAKECLSKAAEMKVPWAERELRSLDANMAKVQEAKSKRRDGTGGK